MKTNYFLCSDIYLYLGFASANGDLIIQNQSKFDMELYFSDSVIDDVSQLPKGYKLKRNEFFSFHPSTDLHVYVRNLFPALSTDSYGVVSLNNYVEPPGMFVGKLIPGATSFNINVVIVAAFYVYQDGVRRTFSGIIATVDNLSQSIFFVVFPPAINTFKLEPNVFLTINLHTLGTITDLAGAFQGLAYLEKLDLPYDMSSVTLLNNAFDGLSSLTSFPLIFIPSVTLLQSTWKNCIKLTVFPNINFVNIERFTTCWENCSKLISFKSLDFSSLTHGNNAFTSCSSLSLPPPSGTDVRSNNDATIGKWPA